MAKTWPPTWRDYLRGDEIKRVGLLDALCKGASASLDVYQSERRAISERARKRMATAHKRAAKEAGE